MAQNAKDYARQQLGNLDLSHLDKEKEVAQNIYNTSKDSLENNFNNLINRINTNRMDTRKNFNMGRATVAENAYNANRRNQVDLASRGLGKSGLKSLGEVGNRMETGKQYSTLANKFYNNMGELDTLETQGRNQYNIDRGTLQNNLDQALAGIEGRGKDAQNNYNMTLGQLAEGIQGRWDANRNAEAALAQQKAAAAQAHRDAVNAARQNLKELKRQELTKIVNNKDLDMNQKANRLQSIFSLSPDMATKILTELDPSLDQNVYRDGKRPVTNYVNQLIGGW